jgi:hypothetical protein
MLNNPQFQILLLKISLASFLVTLFICGIMIYRRAPETLKPVIIKRFSPTVQGSISGLPGDATQNQASKNTTTAINRIRPEFDRQPPDVFSGNRQFALDFHKLPADYLTPQAPETTRNSLQQIKDHKEALRKAGLATADLVKTPVQDKKQ